MKQAERVYDTSPNIVASLITAGGPVVVKLFGWRQRLHYYFSIGMKSRARMSWDAAHHLRQARTRTPEPLFIYTLRKLGLVQKNLLITAGVEPHTTLRKFLRANPAKEQVTAVVNDLARNIARMHNAGIVHNDLTPGNILIDNSGQTYLIDLNRLRKKRLLSVRKRLHDLARINLGTKNNPNEELYTAFFTEYCSVSMLKKDWLGGYRKYRKKILSYRNRKKWIKRLLQPE